MMKTVRLHRFMTGPFKGFSLHDNVRSIPALDGLKDSQRKALWGMLLRGDAAP